LAGRTPVIVDVDAFALQNAYEANYGLGSGEVVVLLNVGASAINVNILQGDQSVFTRDIPMGGNAYTEALQKDLDLAFDAADELKKGVPVDGCRGDVFVHRSGDVRSGTDRDRQRGHSKYFESERHCGERRYGDVCL
jgi:Tfp pilus assembly PilM family ATPase